MYRIFLSLITIASLCIARPLVDEPSSLLSRSPSLGFPAQYLPKIGQPLKFACTRFHRRTILMSCSSIYNQTDPPDHNLKIPMIPGDHAHLRSWVTYDFDRYAEPRLGEFVVSVSMRIMEYWVNEINAPIRTRSSYRRRPYFEFEYIVEPISRPGAVLTPVKAGLGYCWLLQNVLGQRLSLAVPGYVRANLFENSYSMQIATLEVAYRPVPSRMPGGATMANDTVETTQTSNREATTIVRPGGNATTPRQITDLTIPSYRQKRWFSCYAKLIFEIVQMPKSGIVTDYWPGPSSSTSPMVPGTHHFNCENAQEPGDRVMIFVYHAAEDVVTRPTWDRVAKAALEYGTTVAVISGDPQPGPAGPAKNIFMGNSMVLSLQVSIDAASVGNSATA